MMPDYYGEDELVLMVQSPTVVFAYWEVTWPTMRVIGDYMNISFDSLPRMLRIYDVTDIWFNGVNAHVQRNIEIDQHADNWFICDLEPSRTYLCDLGVIWKGRFIPVLRSKPKSTPPNTCGTYSGEMEQITIPDEIARIKPNWFENFSTYTLY